MLVPDWLVKQAQQFPDKIALVDLFSERHVSYAELEAGASRCAEFLRDQWGVQPGERVAVLAHNSAEYVELLYACGKIGAIMVCLNWRLSVDELRGIVDDARPCAIVFGPEFDQTGIALADIF